MMGQETGKAFEKALTFLERRSRTESEVRERLGRAGFKEDVIAETLDRLRDAGLVDDEDYAERYLETLKAKGRGQRRIADEMRRKGLPEDIVRNRVEQDITREDEMTAASEIAERMLEQLGGRPSCSAEEPADDWETMQKKMQKINRKLVSLGYPYEIVGDVMSKLRSKL